MNAQGRTTKHFEKKVRWKGDRVIILEKSFHTSKFKVLEIVKKLNFNFIILAY